MYRVKGVADPLLHELVLCIQVLNQRIPVDTGRKQNVQKTFRRRPGRLLNVLCTFNLRPVPTGIIVGNQ